jgi:hypothetical protein
MSRKLVVVLALLGAVTLAGPVYAAKLASAEQGGGSLAPP